MSKPEEPAPPERPRTRQEVYDRIRQTSRREFILEDMTRLGFWPSDEKEPTLAAEAIRKEGELERELRSLITEHRRLQDHERMLKELRKRRMAEAREKRKQTRERRERERQEKAAHWREKQKSEVVYLGREASKGLNEKEDRPERLAERGLPSFGDASAIARAMEIELDELRFLAFQRRVSKTSHYQRFRIPKKTGGTRLISAPMPRLKQAQRWILDNVLTKVPLEDPAHGFRGERSIVTNANPHVGAAIVMNMDLEDFFPTVSYRRVKGQFRALGYSEQAAIVFALLCTEPDVDEVELDGERFFVARGDRHLPQGAPTSPAVTNILCRRLDRRLTAMASELGFSYSRYADDLTFSTSRASSQDVGKVLRRARSIVEHEGFRVHPKKTRIMRRGRRQEVTGLVVNDKLSIDRKTMRRFRATLFQVERDGPEGKHWGQSPHLLHAMEGFASYVYMVDPDRGRPLLARVRDVMRKSSYSPPAWPRYPKRPPSWLKPKGAKADAAASPSSKPKREKGKKPWWKFW